MVPEDRACGNHLEGCSRETKQSNHVLNKFALFFRIYFNTFGTQAERVP